MDTGERAADGAARTRLSPAAKHDAETVRGVAEAPKTAGCCGSRLARRTDAGRDWAVIRRGGDRLSVLSRRWLEQATLCRVRHRRAGRDADRGARPRTPFWRSAARRDTVLYDNMRTVSAGAARLRSRPTPFHPGFLDFADTAVSARFCAPPYRAQTKGMSSGSSATLRHSFLRAAGQPAGPGGLIGRLARRRTWRRRRWLREVAKRARARHTGEIPAERPATEERGCSRSRHLTAAAACARYRQRRHRPWHRLSAATSAVVLRGLCRWRTMSDLPASAHRRTVPGTAAERGAQPIIPASLKSAGG